MVQMRSILDVADNSGARKISVINPIGGSTGRIARIGDIVTFKEGRYNLPVVHRIIGRCGGHFISKGDHNGTIDELKAQF